MNKFKIKESSIKIRQKTEANDCMNKDEMKSVVNFFLCIVPNPDKLYSKFSGKIRIFLFIPPI